MDRIHLDNYEPLVEELRVGTGENIPITVGEMLDVLSVHPPAVVKVDDRCAGVLRSDKKSIERFNELAREQGVRLGMSPVGDDITRLGGTIDDDRKTVVF